jgi:hypothetical protein
MPQLDRVRHSYSATRSGAFFHLGVSDGCSLWTPAYKAIFILPFSSSGMFRHHFHQKPWYAFCSLLVPAPIWDALCLRVCHGCCFHVFCYSSFVWSHDCWYLDHMSRTNHQRDVVCDRKIFISRASVMICVICSLALALFPLPCLSFSEIWSSSIVGGTCKVL